MAQITDVKTNFQNNNTYWKQVADAIDYCGKDSTDGVATYGNKIIEIKSELDAEIDNLENIKSEYETDFSDINNAIMSKGQVPSGGYDTYAQAILNIEGGEVTINLQEKRVEPTSDEQTVRPDSGYNGLSLVVVEAVKLQSKRVDATLVEKEVLPDSEFLGLSSIVVNPVTSDIDENIKPENIKNGVSILGINGTYAAEGGGTTPAEPVLQSKSVEPTTSIQTIIPDNNYDGLSEVIVGAVTSEIDQNIVASNIKKGISILGVDGTYEASGGSGGIEINNADYICYENARSMKDMLPLLKNCNSFKYAFRGALLEAGNKYEIDMSNAENCTEAFYNCRLNDNSDTDTTLEITVGKTTSGLLRVLNYNGQRQICLVLKKSNVPVSNDFTSFLHDARNIKSINFNNIFDDLENITAAKAFCYIAGSVVIDLSNLDFSKISNAREMFSYLNVAGIVSNDTYFTNCDCYRLCYEMNMENVDIALSFSDCNLEYAFNNCKLNNVKINMNNTKDAKSNCSYMLAGSKIKTITSDNEYLETFGSCYQMFKESTLLTSLPKLKINMNNNNRCSAEAMFCRCYGLENIHIEIINDNTNIYNSQNFNYAFEDCTGLKTISGNLDLTYLNNNTSMFKNCSSLESIETTGSIGGGSTNSSITLDLSASSVFNATSFIQSLAANNSGYTRIIKLHSNVLSGLSDEITALATSKNYTLQ